MSRGHDPVSTDAMSSLAARSFGVSASVMRPTSPYLNAPPLAHSTTSPMACFLVVATRRAAVRNSLRSWLNPELAPTRCHCWAQAKRRPQRQVVWQTRSRQKPWNRCQEAESHVASSTEH